MSRFLPIPCRLCNSIVGVYSAEFRQIYPQENNAPVFLDWWECKTCRGWFVYPLPDPQIIEKHWGTVGYNDPANEGNIRAMKNSVFQKTIDGLLQRTRLGLLLDYGCNFGGFLQFAREFGFAPIGFDPYEAAAKASRERGFEVRVGWSITEAGFPEKQFSAITAIDSFCYSWHPYQTLGTFFELLKPGGVLGMRLSNKHLVLGAARTFAREEVPRNRLLSKILQSQFHSIGLRPLTNILQDCGFEQIKIIPGAATASWRDSSWSTRLSYLVADFGYFLTATAVNVSPGVLLFARKPL